MAEIWAIVLAAGQSKRMKSRKLLLPFGDRTMIEKVIEKILASEVRKIMVVLGSGQEEILKVIHKLPVEHCYNDSWENGMLSSVKCGFRSLPASLGAVMVFLGDQPMISPGVVNIVLEAYRVSGKGIVVPVYANKRGHPLLLSGKYRDAVENLDNTEGLHALSGKFPEDTLEVETSSPEILKDIDNEQDYLREIKLTT